VFCSRLKSLLRVAWMERSAIRGLFVMKQLPRITLRYIRATVLRVVSLDGTKWLNSIRLNLVRFAASVLLHWILNRWCARRTLLSRY